MGLAAGLRTGLLGELRRFPRLPSRYRERVLLLREGRKGEEKKEGKGEEERRG